jgi:hypothetical protein
LKVNDYALAQGVPFLQPPEKLDIMAKEEN